MIKYVLKPVAARYFFRNGCVDITSGCRSYIPYADPSCPNKEPGDIVIDRDFVDVDFTDGDFYKFLWQTSSSKDSFAKKALAIGYMLCNKLPRNGLRSRAFICVNENDGSCANGKSLFTDAVAQFCNTVNVDPRNRNEFRLSDVTDKTHLVRVIDISPRSEIRSFFALCTDDWHIERMCREKLIIPKEKAPYLLLTTGIPVDMLPKGGSFRRRFVVLEFSSFFSLENPIYKYIGRAMFLDWDSNQWHMFDNFMLDCIMQYLYCSNGGEEDIFSLYS